MFDLSDIIKKAMVHGVKVTTSNTLTKPSPGSKKVWLYFEKNTFATLR